MAGFGGRVSMPSASFLSYWYLQLPSLLLAVFIYLLLVRLLLRLMLYRAERIHRFYDLLLGRQPSPSVSPDDYLVMRFLAALTDPVVRVVQAITPRIVPFPLAIAFAIMWLLTLRILLHQVFLARRMFG
jgi:uncharacterized protein YggT (Ycf19 family)